MTSPGAAAPTSASGRAGVEVLLIGGGNMGPRCSSGMIGSGEFGAADLGVVELVEARRAELAAMFPGCERQRRRRAVPVGDPRGQAARCRGCGRRRPRRRGDTGVVDRRRRADRHAPVRRRAGGGGGAGDAEHARPRRSRAPPRSPAARPLATADIEWATRILGSVGTVERTPRAVARRVHRRRRIGPGVPVPRCRGADRRRRRRGDRTARSPSAWCASCSSVRRCCSTANSIPSGCAHQVTSPGGTTAAGVAVFEERDLRGIVAAAVAAATARSRELA